MPGDRRRRLTCGERIESHFQTPTHRDAARTRVTVHEGERIGAVSPARNYEFFFNRRIPCPSGERIVLPGRRVIKFSLLWRRNAEYEFSGRFDRERFAKPAFLSRVMKELHFEQWRVTNGWKNVLPGVRKGSFTTACEMSGSVSEFNRKFNISVFTLVPTTFGII